MAMVPDALTLIDSLILYADRGYGALSEELLVDKGTPLNKKSLPFWFYSFSSFFFFSAKQQTLKVCVCVRSERSMYVGVCVEKLLAMEAPQISPWAFSCARKSSNQVLSHKHGRESKLRLVLWGRRGSKIFPLQRCCSKIVYTSKNHKNIML